MNLQEPHSCEQLRRAPHSCTSHAFWDPWARGQEPSSAPCSFCQRRIPTGLLTLSSARAHNSLHPPLCCSVLRIANGLFCNMQEDERIDYWKGAMMTTFSRHAADWEGEAYGPFVSVPQVGDVSLS